MNAILSVAPTRGGRMLATKLPFAMANSGSVREVLAEAWDQVDALLVFLAVGATVRLIAPLLRDKTVDPAVLAVDELAQHVVVVAGGHRGGNDLAKQVAAILKAEAVISTGTDLIGAPPLDSFAGCIVEGDYRTLASRMLAGEKPLLLNAMNWPIPRQDAFGDGPSSLLVSDRTNTNFDAPILRPPSLMLGVGCSSDATEDEANAAIEATLSAAQLARASVAGVATIDSRSTHPAITGLGLPILSFAPRILAEVEVPHPSAVVHDAVGTPSVSEAAATLASQGGELIVPKQIFGRITVAVARVKPKGTLHVVGIGPGDPIERTQRATSAIRHAHAIVGFSGYLDLISDLTNSAQDLYPSPIGAESARVSHAIALAEEGLDVALVCSGDAGVYAMASLVFELLEHHPTPVEVDVISGVTAALSAAARLGAPLGHDHVAISLSDLLTPWELIEKRIMLAAQGDFVVTFYNPRSLGRDVQLSTALSILKAHRPPDTPVGSVRNIGRRDETVLMTTLTSFDPTTVDMLTTVVVGSSQTRWSQGRMYTPRGYAV
ncbi:MAG: precorrin-3B C(17)-methyltransferase [Acidimicrobiales bacterium]